MRALTFEFSMTRPFATYFLELSPGERAPSGELDGKSEPEHEP